MRSILVAIVASLAGLLPVGAGASIVQNGSFEMAASGPGKVNNGQVFANLASGPGASWQVWDSLPGWTASSGGGIEIQSNRTLTTIDALDGVHYVELDSTSNSSMFQDVMLEVGRYALSFGYSPRRSDAASMGVAYALGTLAGGTVDGTTPNAAVGNWSMVSELFDVAVAGSYRLSFAATGPSDTYGGLIDRVSIMGLGGAAQPAPVPLPPTVLLLAWSGVVLGAVKLSRRM